MVFLVGGANSDTGAYEIDNSGCFGAGGTFLTRSQSDSESDADRRKFTISGWYKMTNQGSASGWNGFWSACVDSNNYTSLKRNNRHDAQLIFELKLSGTGKTFTLDGKWRDSSAWYNIVVAFDSTDGTAADRLKVYINGVRVTGTFSADITQNDSAHWGDDASAGRLGAYNNNTGDSYMHNGYMADVCCTVGYALAPTKFGEFNDNGVWIPKKPSVTYSANGFFCEFQQTGTSANASGLGADTSGNGNHFTIDSDSINLSSTTDTPTNNFCTLNPDDPVQGGTYSEGNCKHLSSSSNRNYATATFGLTSGKWYWEAKLAAVTSNATDQCFFGIADLDDRGADSTGQSLGDRANEVGWHQEEGKFQRNNSWSNGSTAGDSASWGIGDICSIALDCDNNRVTIAKNGQWADGSGNADESSPTSFVNYTASTMTPAMGEGGGGTQSTWECNFGGNPAFSISSGNTDANGYGNFEYEPPSGYYALCTKNLAEYG